MIIAGITLITVGVIIRAIAMITLKDSFTLNLTYQEDIYKKGIYRFSRHPSYIGALLIILGASFINEIVSIMIISWAFYNARIAEEEEILKHNPDYQMYMKRTRKWL
jgi:protein-S-isoprenylcysteine O-methyltransferase Ste14